MISMLKIAVIGGRETVVGFKALGLDVFPAGSYEDAKQILRRITGESEDQYAIIYIEESFAEALDQDISKFKSAPSPAIILIPGREGPLGLGLFALKTAVEKAVGVDIL